MLGRLAFFLLLATLGLGAAALAFDWRVTLPPELADAIGWRAGMSEEGIVEADTRWYLNDAKAMQLIADAVAREDSGDAALFLDIARKLNIPLAGGLEAAALALEAREDSLETQFADYLAGFVSGEGETLAGLGGAITSDLTVYGDIRDIVVEGGKMIAGEDYSAFILGLSTVGLAATAGTIATGGGGIVVKAGLSFVKFAKRSGHLTAAFAARLTRLAGEAIDMPALKQALRRVNPADPFGSWAALATYARTVKGARLFDLLGKMEDIRAAVGTAEALRILKRVETLEEIDDLHGLAKVAGKRTRGVMELTGKTSLRAIKYTANVLQILFEYVWALVLWIAGLLAAVALSVAVSAWRLGRTAWRFARRRGGARLAATARL